jgi:hypothetical protein
MWTLARSATVSKPSPRTSRTCVCGGDDDDDDDDDGHDCDDDDDACL